jgi:hypothetical protein
MIRACLWDAVACIWRCKEATEAYWAAIPRARPWVVLAAVCGGGIAVNIPPEPWKDPPPVHYTIPARPAVQPWTPLSDDFPGRVRTAVPREMVLASPRVEPVSVPEPGGVLGIAVGLMALAVCRIRRKA